MKHLVRIGLAVLLALMMCLGISFAAFADDSPGGDDPPGVDVNIGVSTPGNVNVDMGIQAGGDVSVNVNGAPMASQSDVAVAQQQIQQALSDHTNRPLNGMWDYGYYWKITGIGPRIEDQIVGLQKLTGLSMDAIARLIIEKQISDNQTIQALNSLKLQLVAATEQSEQEDKIIMDKLIYGAETHITAQGQEISRLSNRVDLNQKATISEIAQTTAQINAKIQELENNRITDYNNLVSYIQSVRNEYIFIFECTAGIVLVLLAGVGWLIWRILKLRKRVL